MRAFAYIRVSRVMDRAGDSFLSPDDQRAKVQAWADSHSYEIVDVFEDLDQSGGRMDRPDFSRMMARAGEVDAIAVARLDRFGRTLVGALGAIKDLEEKGVRFVSVAEGVDPATSAGRMMRDMLLVLAEFERSRITESWDGAVATTVAQGKFLAVTPYGYAKVDKRLVPDPEEAPFVAAVFERRAAGQTWRAIAEWLTSEGSRPRRAEFWTKDTVRDLCRHELYRGVSEQGRHRNENAHEPLVSRDLWDRARGAHNVRPVATVRDDLLAGLVRCQACSYSMTPTAATGGVQYRCRRTHGAGECESPATISASLIEPWAQDAFLDFVGELEMRPTMNSAELDVATLELQDAQAAEFLWAEHLAAGLLSVDAAAAGSRKVADRLNAASAAVDAARRAAVGADLPDAVALRRVWPDLTVAEKRTLMAAGLDYVIVRRGRGPVAGRCRLVGRGDGVPGLSRKGRSGVLRAL